jgi:prepilin-type N-terminal cleavage/methylation domain-containing protein/prepilin-type processing-associated H-X9-DG protein
MCNRKKENSLANRAFTLLELLLAVSLIALLAGLIFPTIDTIRLQSESAACASNLRQIGLAVMQKVQDNGDIYPLVEGDPSNPIYAPGDGAESLAETLKPYGVTERVLRCPSDARKNGYFQSKGNSYEWFSFIDGERPASARIYLPVGTLALPPMRFPITADYELVHFRSRMNILFADGHVDSYTGPGVREDIKKTVENSAP